MREGSSRDYRQALADIDITKPNVARVYDYFVGRSYLAISSLGTGAARPGVTAEWRPETPARIEHDENYHSFFGGVARKR